MRAELGRPLFKPGDTVYYKANNAIFGAIVVGVEPWDLCLNGRAWAYIYTLQDGRRNERNQPMTERMNQSFLRADVAAAELAPDHLARIGE